jgi:glycosyltransferase involved in cell wall biosynthesis
MKIINLSYRYYPQQKNPDAWIDGFLFFYNIWEVVAKAHEVIFIEFINYEGRIERKGMAYWFLNKAKYSLLFPFALHRFLKQAEPDVVVVHGLMFPLQVMLLRMALGPKVKIIVQHHAEKPFRKLRRLLQQLADKCTDAYFFTGRGLAALWQQKGGLKSPGKIKEIMEVTSVFRPVDIEEARAETGMYGENTYLWVGRLNANKNPAGVLRSFIRFLDEYPEARLYMVFQTAEQLPELKEMLRNNARAARQIHLIGKVAHSQLRYWYSGAHFILSGSYYEGSGVAVTEAMSCGCIPVITDIPSFRYMTGGTCGYLYTPGNEDDLYRVLIQSCKADRIAEREKVLHQYHRHLSARAIAARIQETISSL